MAYCTQSDIEKQLPQEELVQLTDDDGDGLPDTGVVDEAIAEADAEIDSYLAARYSLPLASVPVLLKKLSVDIAIWNLYSRRAVDEPVRKERYQAAVKLLQAIAEGRASLGVDPEPGCGGQEILKSRSSSDRTFTIGKASTGETGSLDNY